MQTEAHLLIGSVRVRGELWRESERKARSRQRAQGTSPAARLTTTEVAATTNYRSQSLVTIYAKLGH